MRPLGGDIYAGQQSGSHDVVRGVQWFNPGAFAPPQAWQWGNTERNGVFGPGFWNWDIGVQKSFKITEAHRVQLRGDFLDAFNHFNLGTPSSTIADTRDGGLPNNTAGENFRRQRQPNRPARFKICSDIRRGCDPKLCEADCR
jgi:hypothetical protein